MQALVNLTVRQLTSIDPSLFSSFHVFRVQKGGFGLAPVIPAPYFAKRAVKAARYRRQRAVIPSWYSMAVYLQVFQPELLLTVLGFLYRGRPSVAKIAMEALGGGVKHPGGKEFEEAGYRKGE